MCQKTNTIVWLNLVRLIIKKEPFLWPHFCWQLLNSFLEDKEEKGSQLKWVWKQIPLFKENEDRNKDMSYEQLIVCFAVQPWSYVKDGKCLRAEVSFKRVHFKQVALLQIWNSWLSLTVFEESTFKLVPSFLLALWLEAVEGCHSGCNRRLPFLLALNVGLIHRKIRSTVPVAGLKWQWLCARQKGCDSSAQG